MVVCANIFALYFFVSILGYMIPLALGMALFSISEELGRCHSNVSTHRAWIL